MREILFFLHSNFTSEVCVSHQTHRLHNGSGSARLSKSTVMWLKGSSHKKSFEFPDIVIDNTTLQVVTKQKYLGIIFDDCFVWNHHIPHICKKISYYLYIISKHKQVLNSNLMKLLIDPLVFFHLNYSLPVSGPSLHQNQLQRLKRMQNRAVGLCRNLKKHDHVTEHYHALRWLPLEYQIQYKCLCVMNHQYCHGRQCMALCLLLQFGRSHLYGTRLMSTFAHIERCRLSSTFLLQAHPLVEFFTSRCYI